MIRSVTGEDIINFTAYMLEVVAKTIKDASVKVTQTSVVHMLFCYSSTRPHHLTHTLTEGPSHRISHTAD